ncbi:4355_t:CDS:2 [Ambispora gerdemannii]|uniref:4355_t:CDS:1 n=1 Tax=Ambispora gerdemannii TaxID=144530 RepID=A0A9N8YXT1_9GLOM|nr:4355_t:CDS:2 [Ambispora gerdemannii]
MSGVFDMALDEYNNTTNRAKNQKALSRRTVRSQAFPAESGSSNRTGRIRTAPYSRSKLHGAMRVQLLLPFPLGQKIDDRASLLFVNGNINSQWSHDLYEDGHAHGSLSSSSTTRYTSYQNGNSKLLVENLFYEVTQDDLQDLFSKTGAIKKVFLHYDRAGRSLGVADVIFEDPKDAAAALKKYNGTMLEGQEMRIKYAASKPNTKVSNIRGLTSNSDRGSVFDRLGNVHNSSVKQTSRNDLRSRLGRGVNSYGDASHFERFFVKNSDGRRKTLQRKPVTYDDLDADLDAYMAIEPSENPAVNKSSNMLKNGDKMDLS